MITHFILGHRLATRRGCAVPVFRHGKEGAAARNPNLFFVIRHKCTSGTMANMQNRDPVVALVYGIDNPVNVRLSAVEKLAQPGVLGNDGPPSGILFEVPYRLLKAIEPRPRLLGMLGLDPRVNLP